MSGIKNLFSHVVEMISHFFSSHHHLLMYGVGIILLFLVLYTILDDAK